MPISEKVVIYGVGAFGRLMEFYFAQAGRFDVVAYTCDRQFLGDDTFGSLPVVPFETIEDFYPPEEFKMFVAIGYKRMRTRREMFARAKGKGYELVSYISPQAITYEDLVIGENNVVMGGANIEPFVVIGDNNIVWSDTLLGHELELGSHNYISAKCVVAGESRVGSGCFFGNGVTMINNLSIADETMLIAGAVLFRDTKVASKYIGNPAKRCGNHAETGIVITREARRLADGSNG